MWSNFRDAVPAQTTKDDNIIPTVPIHVVDFFL